MTDFVVPEGMPRAIFEAKYSRKKPDGSFQTWAERVTEVVKGNCSLHPTGADDYERLLALSRKGVIAWAGRHLQQGDLEQRRKQMEIFTNCSTAMTSFIQFWLLMKGSGVGRCMDAEVCRVDWQYMPNARFVLSSSHPDYENWIESAEEAKHKYGDESEAVRWFEVEDSAEGWVKVVEVLETAAFQEKHRDKLFIFDFSRIRKCGAPIAGQQGRPASGPVPLIRALNKVATIKTAGMKPWKQAMFIDHFLAECVVLGGVRRSARIATKSWRDRDVIEFIDIKRGGWLYTANNSVTVDEEFWEQALNPAPSHGRRVYEAIISASYHDGTGEPGFLDLSNMTWSDEGVENITADTILSHAMMQKLDIHHRTKDMLGKLLEHAKRKKYPFLVNPCVTADTWIETSEGPRQVRDLVGVPFSARLFGEDYRCERGFFSTGVRPVFEVVLESGHKIKCTENHRLFAAPDKTYEWVQVKDLAVGDVVLTDGKDKTTYSSSVLSITPAGEEEVFDCTINDVHAYVSNGLYSHNCGEIVLAIWGGYCVIGDVCLGNADTEEEIAEAVQLLARALMRVNLMPSLYKAEVDRTNRIGVCLTGIHEWIAKNHGANVIDVINDDEHDFRFDLSVWNDLAVEAADNYAELLHVAKPHTVTSCKPSGCRPWDALTTTTEGILTLEELLENHPLDEPWGALESIRVVQDDGKSEKAVKTHYNGLANVYQVKMSHGLQVEATFDHQWFVLNRDKKPLEKWVKTGDLREGDELQVTSDTYPETEDALLNKVSTQAVKMRAGTVEILQPERMSPDLGWLFGYLWGDGALSIDSYRIRFTDERVPNLEKAQRILAEQFGLVGTTIHKRRDNIASTLDVGSKHLWMWLVRNNLMKIFADELDLIPRVVRTSSKETLTAFFAGLLDADGCVARPSTSTYAKRTLTFTTAYGLFANHIQQVSWAIGLCLGCSHNTIGDNFQKKKSMYLLNMTSHASSSTLRMLEKHSTKVQESLRDYPDPVWGPEYKNKRGYRTGVVKGVTCVGKKETYDIEVENTHWFYAGSIKSHNSVSKALACTEGAHAPAYDYYLRWVQYRHDDPALADLEHRGYPIKDISHAYPETVVVGFPTKMAITDLLGEKTVLAGDMSLEQHYAWLELLEKEWLGNRGNNVSYTSKFRPEDVPYEDYFKRVLEHQPKVRTCSVMPQVDMSAYAYQPEERISKEEYEALTGRIDRLSKEGYDKNALECEGGACPIEFDIN